MLPANIPILITAETPPAVLAPLTANGLQADVVPFIRTNYLKNKQVERSVQQVAALYATVIFTSSNAVRAVHHFLPGRNLNWAVYCVGDATHRLVQKFFPTVITSAVADKAAALANRIVADAVKEAYFFCGEMRRAELPAQLEAQGIKLHEIEVYATILLHPTITKQYDGILFFSPSAVEGFFAANTIDASTVLFAIGDTTADTLMQHSSNPVIIAPKPSRELLVQMVIDYFTGPR